MISKSVLVLCIVELVVAVHYYEQDAPSNDVEQPRYRGPPAPLNKDGTVAHTPEYQQIAQVHRQAYDHVYQRLHSAHPERSSGYPSQYKSHGQEYANHQGDSGQYRSHSDSHGQYRPHSDSHGEYSSHAESPRQYSSRQYNDGQYYPKIYEKEDHGSQEHDDGQYKPHLYDDGQDRPAKGDNGQYKAHLYNNGQYDPSHHDDGQYKPHHHYQGQKGPNKYGRALPRSRLNDQRQYASSHEPARAHVSANADISEYKAATSNLHSAFQHALSRHRRSEERYTGPPAPLNEDLTVADTPEVKQFHAAHQAAHANAFQRLKEAASLAAAYPDRTSPPAKDYNPEDNIRNNPFLDDNRKSLPSLFRSAPKQTIKQYAPQGQDDGQYRPHLYEQAHKAPAQYRSSGGHVPPAHHAEGSSGHGPEYSDIASSFLASFDDALGRNH